MTTLDRIRRLLYSPYVNRALDVLTIAILVAVVALDVLNGTALIAWVLLLGLAGFRLWRLAAVDSITYPIHSRLRESTHPVVQWIDTLWSCPWCLGFWLTTALTWGVWWIAHPYTAFDAFIMMWAASAVTGLTAGIDERLHR